MPQPISRSRSPTGTGNEPPGRAQSRRASAERLAARSARPSGRRGSDREDAVDVAGMKRRVPERRDSPHRGPPPEPVARAGRLLPKEGNGPADVFEIPGERKTVAVTLRVAVPGEVEGQESGPASGEVIAEPDRLLSLSVRPQPVKGRSRPAPRRRFPEPSSARGGRVPGGRVRGAAPGRSFVDSGRTF